MTTYSTGLNPIGSYNTQSTGVSYSYRPPEPFRGEITSTTMPDGACLCTWVHRYALDGQWWLKFRNNWCQVRHGTEDRQAFASKPLDVLPELVTTKPNEAQQAAYKNLIRRKS